jgi:RNA polymerase sigma-70 factor (ECF subfamily)
MLVTVEGALASGCHRAELTAHCRSMLGSSEDAEDAVQETFLRAWRASERFEGRAPLRAWLHRIATNVCLDALGSRTRRPIPVEEVPEPVDAGGEPDEPDPSDRALGRDRLRLALLAAISHLPPRQRAVLLLRDVLSWRASEVAELLGTTPAGVNSALQRAHAALATVDPEGFSNATDPRGLELVARYLEAFADDDVDALVSLSQAN